MAVTEACRTCRPLPLGSGVPVLPLHGGRVKRPGQMEAVQVWRKGEGWQTAVEVARRQQWQRRK